MSAREARLKKEAKLVTGVRIGMIAVAALVGFVEVAQALDWWDNPAWVLYGGRSIIVAGTALEGVWGITRKTRWDRYIALKHKLEKTLTAAIVSIAKETGIEVDALGVSIWAVEEGKAGEPTLVRQGSVRLSGYPPPSSVTWTPGKGVIGKCWSDDAVVYAPLVKLQEKYPKDKQISNTQWAREKSTWGFEQGEFPRQIWKYSQILAVPFSDGTRFAGCLSLDISTERECGISIDSTEVREILGQNGRLVHEALVEHGTL